jgi:hypothetical protein
MAAMQEPGFALSRSGALSDHPGARTGLLDDKRIFSEFPSVTFDLIDFAVQCEELFERTFVKCHNFPAHASFLSLVPMCNMAFLLV